MKVENTAIATGSNRAKESINKVLDSIDFGKIAVFENKEVLLSIASGSEEMTIDEIGEINDVIQARAGCRVNVVMDVREDLALGLALAVTVIIEDVVKLK
jgi:cell division protein FtsZ